VRAEFDQNNYYGSAMDGVTQDICVILGLQQTQFDLGEGAIHASIVTFDSFGREPQGITLTMALCLIMLTLISIAGVINSSLNFVIRTDQTQYCFRFQIVLATFTAPVDRYSIVLTVTTLGVSYVESARLFIYETISYGVSAVFYPNTLTVREDAERRLRVCVSLVSNNSFESPLIEVSSVSIVILNDTSSSLEYEGMDESIETLTYSKAKDQFVTNISSQSTYMECFRLKVANNDRVEGNITVVLGLASPSGVITLSPKRADSQATITIVDDDHYVTVTQEHSRYNVSENRLSVVVCGVLNTSDTIDCAVNYEFEISLNLRDISAVYQNDYGHSPVYLRFSACQNKACADISILNDNITEYDESFGIVLERAPNLDSRISLSPESAVVTIMDDDGMVIGFSSKEYTTTESLGEVSVCVKILNSFNGEALEPFTIALLPDEGFETANAVKDCYKTIGFVIGASVECHYYSIKDDNMCELGIPQQGFQISLAIIATGKIPIRIDLKRSFASIVIDDTSEMECCKLVYTGIVITFCICSIPMNIEG
jgi:hypothetical protein